MRPVRISTGFGIFIGVLIGAIAAGWIPVASQLQSHYQVLAWEAVVATTILPMLSYALDEMIFKGAAGGFITGLGTGLGFFLLFARIC